MAYTPLTDTTSIVQVRSLINEPTALMFSDTDILAWLDEATSLVLQMTLCGEDADNTFTLATGVMEYAHSSVYSAGCIKTEALLYQADTVANKWSSGAKCLIKITPRLFRQLDEGAAGAPIYWTEFNESIWIWPDPIAGVNTHKITCLFYKNITDTEKDASNTLQNLPEYMQEYVVWYAVAKAFERDGKYIQARQYYDIFYNFIMFSRQDVLYKPVDSKSMMKLGDNTQFV